MTVEEIEIIVTAKVEEALKEFQKILPAIKQSMKQAQEAFSKIDTKTMKSKLNHTVNFMKKKIQDLRKSTQNNEIAIKITNKDAKKQISQVQKQIDSLQEKINARQMKLNIINPQIDKIVDDTRKRVTPDGINPNNKVMDTTVNNALASNKDFTSLNSQAQKLYTEIEMYNKQLSEAKSKMAQLGQQTSQTATTQSKLGSFFSLFKQKIEQVKPSISNIKNSFKNLPQITQKITNNIKGMGKGLKSGLGHVIKYAGALFSLRGIYSVLSNSASSWLSSQNAGTKQLSANIDYMKYAMGSALAPVIQFVTNLVYQLMKAIQSVAYALTGVNIFAKATANSYSSMAGSAKKAKQETKQLAGIHDEINNIQDNDNSDGENGSGGGITPSFDLSQMDSTHNSIIEAIKNGDWYQVGATIGEKLNEVMNRIPWNKIQNAAKNIGTNIAKFLNGFIATADWKKVGNTFAQGINTIIYMGQSFLITFDFKNFGRAIGNSLNGLISGIDWSALGNTFSASIKGIFDTISAFFETFDWSVVVEGLLNFIKGFDWNRVSNSIFRALGSACASLVNLGIVIGEKINKAIDNAKKYFQNKIEECGGNIVQGIFMGIIDALGNLGQWIIDHIFTPFINGFKNAFKIHSPSKIMEEMGQYIIEGLFKGLSNIWEKISTIFNNLVSKVGEKFTEIKNNIGKWSENTKQIIKGWAENARNKISECWNNASNIVKEKIYTVKNNISIGLGNAKQTIGNWASDVKTKWSTHWNTMADKVKTGLDIAKNSINMWKDNISSTLVNLGENAKTWGKDLASNMATGIKNNIGKVTNAVSSVANKIKSFLHFSEPDVGPLSNFHTYMPDMIDLMVKGIHTNMNKVTDELDTLANNMSYTIDTNNLLNIPNLDISTNISKQNTQPQNIMEETFEKVMSKYEGNNGQPMHVTIQYLGKTIFDDTIDYINSKTRRTGKNTIVTVGD